MSKFHGFYSVDKGLTVFFQLSGAYRNLIISTWHFGVVLHLYVEKIHTNTEIHVKIPNMKLIYCYLQEKYIEATYIHH